jgi:hypothetical protein
MAQAVRALCCCAWCIPQPGFLGEWLLHGAGGMGKERIRDPGVHPAQCTSPNKRRGRSVTGRASKYRRRTWVLSAVGRQRLCSLGVVCGCGNG